MGSTVNGLKSARRLKLRKSNLEFFHLGSAHDKTGPSLPGRTPDRKIGVVDIPDLCQSITCCIIIRYGPKFEPPGTALITSI
jgi:hypothetical protein